MTTDPIAPIAPVEAPAPAPAPVVPIAPVEAPVTAPVVAAPVVEAPIPVSAEAAPEALAATEIVTVLGETPKEEKPAEAAPEAPKTDDTKEPPKEEAKTEGQSDEPAPLPVFETFKFPEGIQADPETLTEFTSLLTSLETEGKADHAKLQEFGQKAVDFHTKELQKAVDNLNTLYHKTWNETKVKWKDQFLADPEIGGNRAQTTINSALGFLRTHGGTPEQQAEFRQLMDQSGLGNHLIMIRLLSNAGRVMAEGRPLAAQAPPAVSKSRTETMYGQRKNYISQ